MKWKGFMRLLLKAANFMIDLPLRQWSPRAKCVVLVITGCYFLVGIVANYPTPFGGILEHELPPDNPIKVENDLGSEPICGPDFVQLMIDCDELPSYDECLDRYTEMYSLLADKLPWTINGMSSLTKVSYMQVEPNGGVSLNPYITTELSAQVVRERLQKDTDVVGSLHSADASRLAIMLNLPKGYSQFDLYWGVASILEEWGEPSSEWERAYRWLLVRFAKYEIHPTEHFASWRMLGWPFAREAIQRALPVNTLLFCTLGLLLAAGILQKSVRSWRFVAVCLFAVTTSLIWVRGSIWVISHFVVFRELPYIIIADGNTLVQVLSYCINISFIMRARRADQRWERAVLILACLTNLAMSTFSQLSVMWSFQVHSMFELAVMTLVGLFHGYVLTQIVIPMLIDELPPEEEHQNTWLVKGIGWIMDVFYRCQNVNVSTAVLVVACGWAAYDWQFIPLGSKPLEFLPEHHLVRSSHEEVQAEGQPKGRRMAADGLPGLVVPKGNLDIYDPAYLEAVHAVTSTLDSDDEVVATAGIHRALFRLSSELFGHEVPRDRDESDELFAWIEEASLPQCTRDTLYVPFDLDDDYRVITPEVDPQSVAYNRGALTVTMLQTRSDTSHDNIRAMNTFAAAVKPRADILDLYRTGTSPKYGEVDQFIWWGRIKNVPSQLVPNWICFFLMSWLLNWAARTYGKTQTGVRVSAWRMAWVQTVPFLFATACMTITMAELGITLDQANAAILAIANTASSDFTIYFSSYWQITMLLSVAGTGAALRRTFQKKGDQVTEDVVMNAACFFLLMTSMYQVIQQMGWMIPLMLVYCYLGVVFIMPPFLRFAVIKNR